MCLLSSPLLSSSLLFCPKRELASVNRRASTLEGQAADLEKELDERTKALAAYRGEVRPNKRLFIC